LNHDHSTNNLKMRMLPVNGCSILTMFAFYRCDLPKKQFCKLLEHSAFNYFDVIPS
jgi:hypothetical protein